MPAPTEWLLSFASITAIGTPGLKCKDVVGLLGFASMNRFATHDHAAFCEEDLLAQLGHHIPLGDAAANERRCDELREDVRFS
jgi:hypothetical protein